MAGPNSKRVSSHEVARLAGVSQSTVSRVFTPGAKVSEKNIKRVTEAADKLGYRPSFIARSLIQQSTKIIGIVIKNFHNEFYMKALDFFSQKLHEAGYTTMIFNINGDQSIEESLAMALQYQVDGLIITSATLTSPLVEDCLRFGTPVVLFNRVSEGLRVNTVSCDNREAGRVVADYLVSTGHKRIAYVAGEERSSTNRDREEFFKDELAKHGLEFFAREVGDFGYESGVVAARALFSTSKKPDAIFCASDYMGCGILNTARQEFSLRIPQDVSVIGFDDIPMASWPTYHLTTFMQPLRSMVEMTVDVLLKAVADPEREVVNSLISGYLNIRDTVQNRSNRSDNEIIASSPFFHKAE